MVIFTALRNLKIFFSDPKLLIYMGLFDCFFWRHSSERLVFQGFGRFLSNLSTKLSTDFWDEFEKAEKSNTCAKFLYPS